MLRLADVFVARQHKGVRRPGNIHILVARSVALAQNVEVVDNLNNFDGVKSPHDASAVQVDIGFACLDDELVSDFTDL